MALGCQRLNQIYSIKTFIVEILATRGNGKKVEYNIKWEDYDETTWEPACNIPKFIRDYYESTGNGKIPTPRVREVNSVGSVSQYEHFWSNSEDLPLWDPQQHVLIEPAEIELVQDRVCNTRKDRDKRQNRHTCGIFIG